MLIDEKLAKVRAWAAVDDPRDAAITREERQMIQALLGEIDQLRWHKQRHPCTHLDKWECEWPPEST